MLTTPRTLPNRTLYTPASACEATVYSSDDPCGRHAGWSSCGVVVMRGGRHAGGGIFCKNLTPTTRAPSLFTSSLHKCYTTYIDIYRTLVSKRISLAARGALLAER